MPLSELVTGFTRYAASGELNSTVADPGAVIEAVAATFAGRGEADRLDGLMVNGPDWWVNVRRSNTEPLLRLNVEARTAGADGCAARRGAGGHPRLAAPPPTLGSA